MTISFCVSCQKSDFIHVMDQTQVIQGLKIPWCYGTKYQELTVSAFQFEEKFIETPEDLDKLKNGKTKYLNSSDPVEISWGFKPGNAYVCVWWGLGQVERQKVVQV